MPNLDPTTVMPILLACLSYVFTTLHTLRSEQHKSLVSRVSQQLQSLYGPLLACVTASKSSYEAMVRQFSGSATDQCPSAADFRAAVRRDPHGPAACAYRQWVREVLLPLSAKAADLIIARADLLEGTSIEPTLLQLVAHVSAYKVILRQWEQGAIDQVSAISYPDHIHEWISREFSRLKRRQAALLGLSGSGGLMRLAAYSKL
jgi:hypothetical protein